MPQIDHLAVVTAIDFDIEASFVLEGLRNRPELCCLEHLSSYLEIPLTSGSILRRYPEVLSATSQIDGNSVVIQYEIANDTDVPAFQSKIQCELSLAISLWDQSQDYPLPSAANP